MKLIYIILVSFFTINSFAQPLKTKALKVNSVYLQKKEIHFEQIINSNDYMFVKSKKDYNYIGISINVTTNFIFKKDTMSIKIISPEYKNGLGSIFIKNLNFKKGKFIIDLFEYVKITNMKSKGDFEIDNFPEDCMAYRKEDDAKK
ncbi:hypothetical protein NTJ12_002555 [Flavobacterium psychrophilum]|nr:hypothetical protein [Flavobacterium psychrophilum]